MLCKDIMKSDVECISTRTSLQEAACIMRDQNLGFLPVCDDEMRVIGTVTDRDIAVRAVAEGHATTAPVLRIMTRGIISCSPDDDLNYARELMAEHQKSRIVCIDDEGSIEGVISLSDIAQFDDLAGAGTLRQVSTREARP